MARRNAIGPPWLCLRNCERWCVAAMISRAPTLGMHLRCYREGRARKALMRRVRLVIADRRPIVLQGFASLFAAQPDFEVVASCLDGANCLAAVRNLAP